MSTERPVSVHLLPALAPPAALRGGVAVAIDVLRATTTIVHALAAGCPAVVPCREVADALAVAARTPNALLGGERAGVKVAGFHLGNSPLEYTPAACRGRPLVMTTTNGTAAILRAAEADRAIVAAFSNFSAVAEALLHDGRPVHVVCAGSDGEPSLEDTLLAGALVDVLCDRQEVRLNDAARLAWDAWENHGRVLLGALELGSGGRHLIELGFEADIARAAEADRFALLPEVRRDPVRVEVTQAGVVRAHWQFAGLRIKD